MTTELEQIASLGTGPDEVLLPYQQQLLTATALDEVVVCEKSRRVGATWGIAADAVLTAGSSKSAGGQDVFYIAYNHDMTREFVDTCAMWSRAFLRVAVEAHEFLFVDQIDGAEERQIKAFRIKFASGHEIVALSSRPRSLRGRQGYVIIDEAAFHDELPALLTAAFALLIWGGKVLVISTHNGVDNAFNQLVVDCRAGKVPYGLVRITFDDAIAAGLYRRVCLVTHKEWSPDSELAWAARIRAIYREGAAEELDCIPRKSGGRYLASTLLEARAVDVPVLRWALPDTFVDEPEQTRIDACNLWCEENLAPVLATLPGDVASSYLGEDFGRSGDLSVFWPLLTMLDLHKKTPFVVELRNVPFRQQEQVLFWLCERLPRFSGAAFDARGNGQYLAEVARQRFGAMYVAEVMLSERWYRENMPPMRAALEEGTLDIPRDADIVDDLRSLEVVAGVARVPDGSRQGVTGQRHGDGAVALACAIFASRTLQVGGPITFASSGSYGSREAFAGDLAAEQNFAGWNDELK